MLVHRSVATAVILAASAPLFARPTPTPEPESGPTASTVVGRVTSGGRPVADVELSIVGRGVRAASAADGRYTLTLVRTAPAERVTLVATAAGFARWQRPLTLDADTIRVDVALVPEPSTIASQRASDSSAPRAVPAPLGRRETRRESTKSAVADATGAVVSVAAGAYRAPADMPGIRPRHAPWNTEAYDHLEENAFRSPRVAPLSTFSVDVDRASYANVRRFLDRGELPPADAVRIEELVNYFPYADVAPPRGGAPLRITTEVSAAPWNAAHDLVRIALRARDVDMRHAPASNLVFLIDVSGSMQGPGRLPLVKQSLAMLVEQLREQDRVAIVVYAGNAGLVLPSTSGADKQRILAALDGLEAGGSTAGGAGIQLAYDVVRRSFVRGGTNRVILCTDGDFNVGQSSDGALVRLIEQRRGEGAFLTILGFGMGNYKDARMEKLADAGNGNYAYVDDLLEARKMLVKEMGGTLHTVAKDVKLQVEFNPARVRAYRLLGYEDRLLHDEDFTDDAKDAGDVGAGHTVTALYEIVRTDAPLDVPLHETGPRRYGREEAPIDDEARSDELLHVALRYKEPDGTTSRLLTQPVLASRAAPTESMRFASAVAGFGMLLRGSPFAGSLTWPRVVALARGARGDDRDGYRADFIRLAELAGDLSRHVATAPAPEE